MAQEFKQYWVLVVFDDMPIGVFSSCDELDNYARRSGITGYKTVTVPMIRCDQHGEFPRMGQDTCPVCPGGKGF